MNSSNYKWSGSGKKWVGVIFLVLGLVLLSQQLGLFIPNWVTSWPMVLIIIGLISGRKHQFRNPGSYFLILIGGIFLLDKMFESVDLHDFAWPVVIIGVGLYLIVGKRRPHFRERNFGTDSTGGASWDKRVYEPGESPVEEPARETTDEKHSASYTESSVDDYLDTVSVFGGIKKNVVSKNFKGGDITTVMGGAEINFMQADINGTAVLEVTQLFGGTKIIVPPQWKVSSEMVALFGGVEDKRPIMQNLSPSPDKVLIIRGTSIFGGIDIRNY